MKRRIFLKHIARGTRTFFVFTAMLGMAVSPFMDRLAPYLAADIAERVEVQTAHATTYAAADVIIFIEPKNGTISGIQSSGDWTVPGDWNPASNSIQTIGAGGAGGDGSNAQGAGGGGGGGYGRINNVTFAAASTSIPFSVGASGSVPASTARGGKGGNSWFGKSTFALCNTAGTSICVSAEGGEGGHGTTVTTAALGGNTASASGTVEYAGGNGGVGTTTNDGSGGGGGAAGPLGAGKNGASAPATSNTTTIGGGGGGGSNGGTSTAGAAGAATTAGAGGTGYVATATGGAAGNGTCGTGAGTGDGKTGTAPGSGGGGGDGISSSVGCRGGAGQIGTSFDSTHGPGGGGGGAADSNTQPGGAGGEYGGGGGGGSLNSTAAVGYIRGGDGLIVIKYRPIIDLIPTAIGTQDAAPNVPEALTSTYLGGAFKFTTTQTTTVSSIAITASTSTGAVTGLSDVKLYWDTAANCDTATPITSATLFNSASASFSGMKATIAGSKQITGTTAGFPGTAGQPICFYPVLDVDSTVESGMRLDLKIEASGDITSSVTTPNATFPLHIPGVSVFSSNISVSGTCKQSDNSTNCTDAGGNHKVRVAVNGTLKSQVQETVGGTWTISSVAKPSTNDVITVFLEGEAASSSQAVAVTKYSGSGNITSVELIEGRLSIGSNQNNSVSNANLGQYDSSVSGKHTFHDLNATTMTVDVDNKVLNDQLYISTGDTFQPNSGGGDTVAAGHIELRGTLTADSNAITASGSWDDNGTFTAGTSTLTMTGVSQVLDASTFNNLTINTTGTITASGSATVGGTLTSTAGTLSIPSGQTLTHSGSTLTLSGTISGAGTLKETASGFTFPTGGTISSILTMDTSLGNQTLSARTYGGAVNVTNSGATNGRTVTLGAGSHTYSSTLTISSTTGSVELTGSANNPTVGITGALTYTAGGGTKTITTGSGVWTASGDVNLTNGTFTASPGNKLIMNGASRTLTSASQTLRNLTLSGTISLAAATHTINGNFDFSAATLAVTGSTVVMSSISASLIGGNNILANLTIDPSSSGTITMATSNTTVSGVLTIAANDTLKIESGRTLTLSGNGTPLVITGTLDAPAGSTVQYTHGTSANVTAATYGNLTLGGIGTYTLPSSGTPTIKGTLTINASATVTKGTATLLFRAGTTQVIDDNTAAAQDLGEIRVMASTSGNTLLTFTSAVKVASVTIDASQTLDLNGANLLTLTGTGNVLTNNGSFIPGAGTVQYTGATANIAAVLYKHLTLGGTGTYTLPASDVTIGGNLTVTTGATVTKSASNKLIFAIGGGGTQTLTGNATNSDLGIIQVSANTGNSTLNLGSAIKVTSVTIDASQTLNVNGTNLITLTGTGTPFTNSGVFQPSTGTVQYTATSATVGASKYHDLTLGGTGTYTLPSTGTTTLLGNLAITSGATVASGSSTLFFRAGGSQSITDSNTTKVNIGEIAVQASTSGNTTLTLGSSVRISSASVDASQTLDSNGSNTITITGTGTPLTVAGTFTRSTGVVTFVGPGSTFIPALNYYDLKVQPSVDGVTHTFLAGTASVSKTFTVGNGTNTGISVTAATNASGLDVASVSISANSTLIANASQQLTVGYNWINNGAFTHSSGTVTFDLPVVATISGTTTFNNVTSTVLNKTLKFKAGQTFTFAGALTLTGSSGNEIHVQSTELGRQWIAFFNSLQSAITNTWILDSGCAIGSANVNQGTNMVDYGNNGVCWFRIPIPPGGGPGGTAGGFTDGGSSGGGVQRSGGSAAPVAPPVDDGGSGGGGQEGGGDPGGGGGGTP